MDAVFNNAPHFGTLLHEQDLSRQKRYFLEMCRLIGINVLYRAPKPDKHWTTYAEIDGNYESPRLIGCIFNEHPDQKTMKKLGWAAELQEEAALISVPYDLAGLQVGSLFSIPDVFDKQGGRLFRVVELSTIMMAPASITCRLVPEYKDTWNPSQSDHTNNTFTYLNVEEEPNMHNG